MSLVKLLDDSNAMLLVSILLGLGLAALFQKKCNSDKCAIINIDPKFDINQIERRIENNGTKCYKYNKIIH